MRKVILTTILCLTAQFNVFSCVTVVPESGTYTVDKNGCVDQI